MLSAPRRMDSWQRRGLPHGTLSPDDQLKLIRCLPEDGMNGFFVALFVRRSHESVPSAVVLDCRRLGLKPKGGKRGRSEVEEEPNDRGSSQLELPTVSKFGKKKSGKAGIFWRPYSANSFY